MLEEWVQDIYYPAQKKIISNGTQVTILNVGIQLSEHININVIKCKLK